MLLRLACPDAGTKASALSNERRTVLGFDWTPFSAGVRCVEQTWLQSSTLSPHSTGTRTGKLLASPQVLQSGGLCELSSWQILTAVSSQVGSHGGGRARVSDSGSCLPGEAWRRVLHALQLDLLSGLNRLPFLFVLQLRLWGIAFVWTHYLYVEALGWSSLRTGTRCLPDVGLAWKIIYPPCARRAPSLLIRVSVWCTPRLLASRVVILLRLQQRPANANCGAVILWWGTELLQAEPQPD